MYPTLRAAMSAVVWLDALEDAQRRAHAQEKAVR